MKGAAMNHYIGLDAHSTTCTFVCLDKNGNETQNKQIATNEANITDFLSSLSGKKSLVFEESTLAKWLHAITTQHVDQVTVCNPTFVRKKNTSKNDYNDSLHLAHELRKGHLSTVYHNNENPYIPMRALVTAYRNLNAEIVRSKNQLKSIYRSEGIKKLGSKIYSDPNQLEELTQDFNHFSADALMYQLSILQEIKSKYREQFEKNVKRHPILKKLITVPQVSSVRANTIAAFTCDGQRFPTKHQYWSYIGLVDHKQQSDGRYYGIKRKYGRSELKDVFMGMAQGALLTDNFYHRCYDKLRSQGKNHKAARRAVARKMASIVLTIFKKDIVYDDRFEENQKRKINI